jgi:hypothetical protein
MPLYTNAKLIRDLTPLLTQSEISDSEINRFANHFEVRFNNLIGRRYKVPVIGNAIDFDSDGSRFGYKVTGTIATTQDNTTITGTSTIFNTQLFENDIIRVGIHGECFQISSINSDTSLSTNNGALNTKSGQDLYLIPPEISMVSSYYSAQAIIMEHFSEQAFNQQTESFQKNLEMFAKPSYDSLINGDLFLSQLKLQTTANNNARLVYVNSSNDRRVMIDAADTILTRPDFTN